MKRDKSFREQVFWMLDSFNGSPIKSALHETNTLLDRNNDSNEAQLSLDKLIKHATSTTTYYSSYSEDASIDEFPLINKNIIRDNLSQFLSSECVINKCKKVSTSGSTGTPFSVYHNKEKTKKNKADNIYFSSKSGYTIGDYLIYIKIWPESINKLKSLNLKVRNIHPHSVYDLTGEKIEDLIEEINTIDKNVALIGYASAFEKICRYLDSKSENPITFRPSSIITISEALNTYTRNAIKKYFGIYPISRYSNNENGIIAQQVSPENHNFKINTSSYLVEMFDLNEDKKIGFGQRGRIVITDLYNYATPLIRYDTGDVGIMYLDENNQPYFSQVLGRKLDLIYDTKGNLVPEHLSAKLCNYGQFKQFQLVQKKRKEYLINLNTTKKVDEEKMITEYKGYFGDDAKIDINYVDEIHFLSSGTRKEAVNGYYATKWQKSNKL